jgi:HAD superfamily phosphoserine phosphatase-like hydrolase
MLGEKIIEVDIGRIEHDSQPLQELSVMASQVIRTLFHRAEKHRRFHIEQLMTIEEWERREESGYSKNWTIRSGEHSICLFDMDGTLIQGRFILSLAQAIGKGEELAKYLDHPSMHSVNRTKAIGRIFAGVPFETFVAVARQIPLCDGAVETIRILRQRGFRVGIVSDSFRVATETIRRRVFADFSVAHLMGFENRIATGEIELCRAMFHDHGCPNHLMCKKNVVLHLASGSGLDTQNFAAVGDGENDICMFNAVKTGIAFEPKSAAVRDAANHVINGSLSQILPILINGTVKRSCSNRDDYLSMKVIKCATANLGFVSRTQ